MCDNAKPEMYGQTRDILCMYEINDQQSKPHYQHQNPAECKIQDVKRMMNSVMDCTGTPSKWWLLAALYVLGLVCLLPNANGEIPTTAVTGQILDVSKYMHFHHWQEVFVSTAEGGKEELA